MKEVKRNTTTLKSNGSQDNGEAYGIERPHLAEDREITKLARWSGNLNLAHVHETNLEQPEVDGTYELPALVFLSIKRYEGETCGGQFDGEGVASFEEGHTYKGIFSKGLMDGFGVITLATGLKYEGEFVSNMPMGRGTYTWPDGSTYTGEVYNGVRHGMGTYKCAKNSLSYTGQWDKGKWHGKGTAYYNEDKTSWYIGDWVMNNREGWGERCYPSGNIYSGEWKNNTRHGEGAMRWQRMEQQYVGKWQDGVQHGRGTHVWISVRTDGSQYSQNNQYKGDFFQGQRHGEGTFHYAGGSVYKGGWKNNKKHGQGKFTFQDGRVFEGEFVDDQMKIPNLNGNRAPTPFGGSPLSGGDSFKLGPDMALSIECLLEKIPKEKRDTERKQVEFVLLQQVMELRSIYSFYSRLGHSHSPDNTFLLSRLQFWRLLKDCNIHHHGVTLTQIDHFIREEAGLAEIHSPFTPILHHKLLSSLVIVAHRIYSKDMMSQNNLLSACLSKLITDAILPNAKEVKGFLFKQPDFAVVAMKHMKQCWEVYEAFCRVNVTMTYRHLLWMFKDLRLLDHKLTTARLLEIITAESQDRNNLSSSLDLEITFLEFFEVLAGCAEVKLQQVSDVLEEDRALLRPDSQARSDLPAMETGSSTGQEVESQHVRTEDHKMPDSTEDTVENRHKGKEVQTSDVKDHKLNLRIQTFHQFLNRTFFPAYEHHQLVTREMETFAQEAQRRKEA
ncbi:radial spoke head 10 homolog B [Odontesthes bonariensis]|uniref:radial spoke head 10 homolog B n=1 Tax=Odontesthes bonariensis TaxID=219752 RepID=UPI003F5827A8